ncbi:MAG: methyltransferase domain-containing protein [Anaerolineaceae bacterium]|nr:methyltransferase domain-containing protein [Anaerolineaceae bacterium]
MSERRKRKVRGWDALAAWYDGWVGPQGSVHHQRTAIPATLDLLAAQPGERILDVGCGQGVLAPHLQRLGADYTGIDISPRMVQQAKRLHGKQGRFFLADAVALDEHRQLREMTFAAAVFLLSIQDMNPLADVLQSVRARLTPRGRMIVLMTHPCFRIPRQSGWGWDEGRKLRYRRVDHYLTPLSVPMKAYPGGRGVSISFHRSLGEYIEQLTANGLSLDALRELPASARPVKRGKAAGKMTKAEERAQREIPLFLALRARLNS